MATSLPANPTSAQLQAAGYTLQDLGAGGDYSYQMWVSPTGQGATYDPSVISQNDAAAQAAANAAAEKAGNFTYVTVGGVTDDQGNTSGGTQVAVPNGTANYSIPTSITGNSIYQDVNSHSNGALSDIYSAINSGSYVIQNGQLITQSGQSYNLSPTNQQNVYGIVVPTTVGGTYTIPIGANLQTGQATMPDALITTPQAITYTGGQSGSFLGGILSGLAPIAPILNLASIAFPALAPVAASLNTAEAINNNNPLAALASATGIPGVSDTVAGALPGNVTGAQVTSTAQMANNVNNLVNAVNSGNTTALLAAAGSLSGVGATQLGSTGLTAGDATKIANLVQAVQSGNQNAIINATAQVAGSSTIQSTVQNIINPPIATAGGEGAFPGAASGTVASDQSPVANATSSGALPTTVANADTSNTAGTNSNLPTNNVSASSLSPLNISNNTAYLTSTGISDSAPGTIFNDANGQEIVLNSGKTVPLSEYQSAINQGLNLNVDGSQVVGSGVTNSSAQSSGIPGFTLSANEQLLGPATQDSDGFLVQNVQSTDPITGKTYDYQVMYDTQTGKTLYQYGGLNNPDDPSQGSTTIASGTKPTLSQLATGEGGSGSSTAGSSSNQVSGNPADQTGALSTANPADVVSTTGGLSGSGSSTTGALSGVSGTDSSGTSNLDTGTNNATTNVTSNLPSGTSNLPSGTSNLPSGTNNSPNVISNPSDVTSNLVSDTTTNPNTIDSTANTTIPSTTNSNISVPSTSTTAKTATTTSGSSGSGSNSQTTQGFIPVTTPWLTVGTPTTQEPTAKEQQLQQIFSSLDPGLQAILAKSTKAASGGSIHGIEPELYDIMMSRLGYDDGGEVIAQTGNMFSDMGKMANSMAPKFVKSEPRFLRPAGKGQPMQLGALTQLKQAPKLGALAHGGLPSKYEENAPKGHKPEFITGLTGYYAGGRGTGQSDDIPAMLHEGDWVADADVVAALGDGSSKAGAETLIKFMHQVPHEDKADGKPVPAKIADGEVVLPESFVTALGGGDNKHGAKMLDQMRKNLREHKRSAPLSKIPPKAKSPLEYLKGVKG